MYTASRQQQSGITLLELLVVMVILGLIMGLVGPAVWNALGGAKQDTAKTQIGLIGQSLNNYRLDTGRYPTTEEGLKALIEKPASAKKWRGPYLTDGKVPVDPWDRPYIYKSPGDAGKPYILMSYGSDGQPGGEGESEDVSN